MNLKKIQAFVAVIEKGSISVAAADVGRSQPAVSQQIKSLEEDFGVLLLDRNSSKVQPTAAGNYIYKTGRQMLEQWEEMEEGIRSFIDTATGTLKIGASTIPGSYFLPRWIGHFHRLFPKIDVVIEIGGSREVISRLHNKQVDIAVVGSLPEGKDIVSNVVAVDSLVLITPQGHSLAASDYEKDPCELARHDFVLREKGSGTREAMEKGLTHCGIQMSDLHSVARVGSTEAVIAAVEEGLGISFISKFAAIPAFKAGRVQQVSIAAPLTRTFYVSTLKGRKENPIIKQFSSFILNNQLQKED